jgi:SPP1 family predicted phage head-tail adaptor
MLDPGKLQHRVTIQALVSPTDSNGDPLRGEQGELLDPEWTDVATVWAAIEPLSAREFIQSSAMQSQVTARITIRARAGITPAMRAVHGSKVYNIEGVLPDKESGLEYLTLPCSEGVNAG